MYESPSGKKIIISKNPHLLTAKENPFSRVSVKQRVILQLASSIRKRVLRDVTEAPRWAIWINTPCYQ